MTEHVFAAHGPRQALRFRLLGFTTALSGSMAVGGLLAFAPSLAPVTATLITGSCALGAVALVRRDGWALSLLVALGVVPILAGLAQNDVINVSPLAYVDDAALAAGWLLLIVEGPRIAPGPRRTAVFALALLLASELVGLVGMPASSSVLVGGFWADLRWVGAIGWGLLLANRLPPARCHRWAFGLLAAWGVGNLLASFFEITRGAAGPARFSIPMVEGIFGHATSVGVTGALLVTFAVAARVSPKSWITPFEQNALLLLGLANIVLSTRSKAVAALLLVLAFLALYPRVRWQFGVAVAVALIPILSVPAISLLGTGARDPTAPGSGVFFDVTSHSRARDTLLSGATSLAMEQPPFGYGIATWASGQEPDREGRALLDAGVGGYGFTASNPRFRSDSLVAHVLGERGYLGLALWCLALGTLMLAALRASPISLFPAAAILIAAVISPVAPSLSSGPIAFLLLFPAALLAGSTARLRGRSLGRSNGSIELTGHSATVSAS